MNTIRIPGNIYNALRACSATDDVRYYLNGILVDVANQKLVATDGHRLFAYPIDAEKSELDPESLDDKIVELPRRKADAAGEIVITFTAEQTTITSFSTTGRQKWVEVVAIVDGTFPDYAKVIPPWGEGPRDKVPLVSYNPRLIGEVVAALNPVGFPCRVVPTDPKGTSALLVQLDGYPDATLVLMPMRGSWS